MRDCALMGQINPFEFLQCPKPHFVQDLSKNENCTWRMNKWKGIGGRKASQRKFCQVQTILSKQQEQIAVD